MTVCKDDSRAQKIVNVLSPYEKEVLTHFFRYLIENECIGYTFFGEKPLSVEEFNLSFLPLSLNERLAFKSAILKEGYRIWLQSGLADLPSDYAILASEIPNSEKWIDLLVINRKSFLKTVEKDLVLFQYILGPTATSDTILNQFFETKQNLSTIFRDDRILIGIILGYGTQNALYGSRLENIHEKPDSKPSLGFREISEEKELLEKKIFTTTDYTKTLPRLPWFSAIQHEETDRLLREYTLVQTKIQKILNSSNFMENVLSHLFACKVIFSNSQLKLEELLFEKLKQEKKIDEIVSQILSRYLKEENATQREIESFIMGMWEVSKTNRSELKELLKKEKVSSEEREALAFLLGQKGSRLCRCLDSIASISKIIEGIKSQENIFNIDEEIINQINLYIRVNEQLAS